MGQNKVQQRISKKNESEKNKATNDKKKAIKNDSDNDEDRQNWVYTADEVYPDAPFRLQDYRKKLESGLVKEAPSCHPYRTLYFLYLDILAADKQSSRSRKREAKKAFNNLISVKINEAVTEKKKLAKK